MVDYLKLHADYLHKGILSQLILDSAFEAVITSSPDRIITTWSKGAERIYGYTEKEIVGKSGSVLIPAEKQSEANELLDRIIRGEKIEERETQRLTKSGKTVDLVISVAPIIENGKVIGSASFHKDISLRKKAEKKYFDLFEYASDAIFIADLNGKYTEVNIAATKMLGYKKEELIGKTILDLIPPEEAKKLQAAKEYLVQSKETQIAEWSLKKKDGTYIPVEVSAKILDDGRWQGFVRDLSKQKAAERKFSFLFESAPDAQIIVNTDGVIQLANHQCEKTLGYRKDELIGQKVEILLPEKSRKSHPEQRAEFITQGKSRRMGSGKKLYALRKDKSELPVDILLSPVTIDNEILVLAVIRDLTELKKMTAYSRSLSEVREKLSI